MDLGLNGKTALVIGASRGMGLAVANELTESGCSVLRVSRSAGDYQLDVSDETALSKFIQWATESAPDVVVHVVGGSAGIRDETLPSSEWAKVWRLNLGAAIDINTGILPKMIERGWGRIVHFSSNGVKLSTGRAPYVSAKAALEGYVRMMARLYASRGVVFSAVSPGPINTPGLFIYSQDQEWTRAFWDKYVPMGRWGRDEEVAAAVALLCSERASYMAGAIVDVDGGMR